MANKIITVKISELKETEHNPRTISKDDFNKLKKSLQEDPEFMDDAREVVVDENLTILGGHQRVKAWKALGNDEIKVKQVTGWSEEKKRRFVIKDNVQNGDWDMEELANAWDDLPLEDWGVNVGKWGEQTEYQNFVDKFKPKLTTDDCYTPPKVFEAVEKWVRKEYNIPESVENIRPFKPEGDYKSENYEGKVVIDNPPFSIMAEILNYYVENNIKFFLFYDQRTLLGTGQELPITRVLTNASVVYENGAVVSTSFITNMDDPSVLVYCSAELANIITEAQPSEAKEQEAYDRPSNSATAMDLVWFTKANCNLKIKKDEAQYVKNLDNLKAIKKGLYGGGMLISDNLAQKLEAQKLAAQKLAAQKRKIKVALSEREQKIVEELNNGRK